MLRRILDGLEAHKAVTSIFTFQPTADHAPVNIRTTLIDGEPWFVAKDVCLALGYPITPGISNANNYTKKLADDERTVLVRGTTGVNHLPLFEGTRIPRIQIISESGLYTLCLRSDKADAKPFQDWVTREVLPSIRKTGKYALADHGREAMPLPLDIAEAVTGAFFGFGGTP